MNATINERIEPRELPTITPLCEMTAPRPSGKAAVLQDQFMKLLTEASKTYKKQGKLGDKSRYVTLECADSELTGEVWNKSGEYVRLETIVPARTELPFRIAIDLEVLKLTIGLAYKGERIDLKVNFETNTLAASQNYTNMYGQQVTGWRSNFKGLPQIEVPEPIDSKPVVTYTKEQKTEFKWIAKATAKTDNRPVLRFAYVEGEPGKRFIASADGHRAHISMNETNGLDGFIDVNSVGFIPDEWRYPDVGYIAAHITGQKVNMYYGDLLQSVKAVMKMQPDADELVFTFSNHILTITGNNVVTGVAEAHLLCSTVKDGFFRVNGKFVLDALAGCDGIPQSDPNKQHTVMIRFENDKKPISIIPHPGRMAIVMPMESTR